MNVHVFSIPKKEISPHPSTEKKARTPVVASDPLVLEKEPNCGLIYAQFRQCFVFNTPSNLTKEKLANVNKIWNAAMNIKELAKGTISFKPDMNNQALKVRSISRISPHINSSYIKKPY